MKKIRNVSLKIVTENGGEISTFQTQAKCERTDGGEKIRYPIGNGVGELYLTDSYLEMYRRGDCGLSARFCEGRESDMSLSEGGLEGSLSVRTDRYRIWRNETGIGAELSYRLFGGKNVQTFLLKIQIKFISEE